MKIHDCAIIPFCNFHGSEATRCLHVSIGAYLAAIYCKAATSKVLEWLCAVFACMYMVAFS